MKNARRTITLMLLVSCLFTMTLQAQEKEKEKESKTYFQISPRVGYDFLPMYGNNTPYIDYKGGLELGISVDYYWNWIGLGVDVDYIFNTPESTYPTENLHTSEGNLIENFALSENKINRLFYGIGPNFKISNSKGNFVTEINTRIGMANIKGGEVSLTDTARTRVFNFYGDYEASSILSFKGQIRFNYFFNTNWGVSAGAYYMNHFTVSNQKDEMGNYAASYSPFSEKDGVKTLDREGNLKIEEPCDCNISSIGASLGLVYKFGKKAKKKNDLALASGVAVTAKDLISGKTLPNTEVVLVDLKGNIIKNGITNSYGVVVFDAVPTGNYVIKGKLYDTPLQGAEIKKEEFEVAEKNSSIIQKEILYKNEDFILKGVALECRATKVIEGVSIVLKDKINSEQKNTISGSKGNFIFHLKQKSAYTLRGYKQGYFSNEIEIGTQEFDRNQTIFIDFEMCINPCGKAIQLNNIHFNLDKWDILPKAKEDLDYVVELMKDNPEIKVEMSSHTDSRASYEYNEKLSQRRAQATVNYLVSKGISRSRLISRGAGETELLNRCSDNVKCTEEEHAINRRTEFKIVCP